MQESPENQHFPRKKRTRFNPVTPLDRIWIGGEDVANVYSLSPSMEDELIRQRIIPEAHVYFGSLPRWHVGRLLEECAKLAGDNLDSEDWSKPQL